MGRNDSAGFNFTLLSGKTTTGAGAPIYPRSLAAGAQASLSGTSGALSATVLIEVSADPRAKTDPASAVWTTAVTFSLSGTAAGQGVSVASDTGKLDAPWLACRARVSAILGVGAAVDAFLAN